MSRIAAVALWLLVLTSVPATATAQTEPEPAGTMAEPGDGVVINDGHVDIGPVLVDDEWQLRVKHDTGDEPTWRLLEDVVFTVVDEARLQVPDSGFDFLGQPGDDIWVLPQNQAPGVLWPGWNTQHPTVVDTVDGPVTWTVHGVDGPGSFVLYLSGSFGEPEILFQGTDPLPQEISIPLGTHVHGNWVFGHEGVYRLDIEMSGTTGTDIVSDQSTLTFAVGGQVDPGELLAANCESDSPGELDSRWLIAVVPVVLVVAWLTFRRRSH